METRLTQVAAGEPKPYHHGDLRRALLKAAIAVLEREGLAALSLRAVAREAGVSPAAPYHHFKDKNELLGAVGAEGFARLNTALIEAAKTSSKDEIQIELGVAYVEFAKANPALYRVMWESARNSERMPTQPANEDAFAYVRGALHTVRGHMGELDVELTTIAHWCVAHGLAEMNGFAQFEALKEALGGERAFLRAVLQHLGAAR